jgi:hypothetical protein
MCVNQLYFQFYIFEYYRERIGDLSIEFVQ